VNRVADVKLHYHVLAGIAIERVPWKLTVHGAEFHAMVMIADEHSMPLDLLGQLVEELGRIEPCLM